MKAATIIHSLVGLGFELAIVGDEIVVRRAAFLLLNPEGVKPLINALKQHKPAVMIFHYFHKLTDARVIFATPKNFKHLCLRPGFAGDARNCALVNLRR